MPLMLFNCKDFIVNFASRFLDRWITLSSAREIGELFVPALAALGRSRRHDAVVGICSVMVADVSEGMRDLTRASNAIILGETCAWQEKMRVM